MPLSLYEVVVPQFRKMLINTGGLLDKAEAFCEAQGIDPGEVIRASISPDMLPFAYQIKSVAVHSAGAIEGVRKGVFAPDTTAPGETFSALRGHIERASTILEAVEPPDLDGFLGQQVRFLMREYHADFLAEQFLLSFSLPNFYFHVTTAYDLLRARGITIGKVDYLGRLPLRRAP